MGDIAYEERACPFCNGGNPWRIEGVPEPPPCRFCTGDGAVVPADTYRGAVDLLRAIGQGEVGFEDPPGRGRVVLRIDRATYAALGCFIGGQA